MREKTPTKILIAPTICRSNHYVLIVAILVMFFTVGTHSQDAITCVDTTLFVNEDCEAQIPPIADLYSSETPVSSAELLGLPLSALTVGTYQFTIQVIESGVPISCEGTIDVLDTIPMEITCITDQDVAVDDECRAIVPSIGSASDNCGPIKFEGQDPEEGKIVGIGMHEIIYTAADNDLNIATCATKITVVDTTSPIVECIANVEQTADDNCEGTIPDIGSATDNCGGAVSQEQLPAAGTKVDVGVHTIEYTVQDKYGNTASCSTQINIVGTGTLDVTCSPDMEVYADENCEASIPSIGTAGGDCVAVGAQIQSPIVGTMVGIGQTVINYSAQTSNFNTPLSCASNFVVLDNTPPVQDTNQGGAICIWPPNDKFYCEPVSSLFQAMDNCDANPDITYFGCQSSPTDQDSDVCPDCVYDETLDRVCFRADAGHTYTVEASVVDGSGNDSIFTRIVHVPEDDAASSDISGCVSALVQLNGFDSCTSSEQDSKGSPGAKGSKGSPGAKGSKGSPGAKGSKGSPSAKGSKGSPGAKGSKGSRNGKSGKGNRGGKGGKGSRGGKDSRRSRGKRSSGKSRNQYVYYSKKSSNIKTGGKNSKRFGNAKANGKFGKGSGDSNSYVKEGKRGGYGKNNDSRGGKRNGATRGKGRSRNGKRTLRGRDTFIQFT